MNTKPSVYPDASQYQPAQPVTTYAVVDRNDTIHTEPSKKAARRSQKAFGGLVVRSKNGSAYKAWKTRKVFLWVFLAIQAIFIIWLVVGVSSTGGSIHTQAVAECLNGKAASMGMTQAQCVSWLGGAAKVGTSLGAAVIVIVWVVVDFFLGLGYGIYRLARR
jgi:hypothetical protein